MNNIIRISLIWGFTRLGLPDWRGFLNYSLPIHTWKMFLYGRLAEILSEKKTDLDRQDYFLNFSCKNFHSKMFTNGKIITIQRIKGHTSESNRLAVFNCM